MTPEEALERARVEVIEKTETLRLASVDAKGARAALLDASGQVKLAEAERMRADMNDDSSQHRLGMAHRELSEAHRRLHDLVCGCGAPPVPTPAAETKPTLN